MATMGEIKVKTTAGKKKGGAQKLLGLLGKYSVD